MDLKKVHFDVVSGLKILKNQARGNRKTLKRTKMMSKINFRNL